MPNTSRGGKLLQNLQISDQITPKGIVAALEDAGGVLLSLPNVGFTTRLRTAHYDIVHAAIEAYGWASAESRLRPPVPNSAQITLMDEAFAWLTLIPSDKYVLRRIVGARALVSPLTGRHLHPWRRLATLLGADHKAIQRWHGQGIAIITQALARQILPATPVHLTSAEVSPSQHLCPASPIPSLRRATGR